MRSIWILATTIFLATASSGYAERVYFEGFEDGNAADTYGSGDAGYWSTFTGATEVIDDNPHAGTYSLRGSLSENGTADDITAEDGVPNIHGNIGLGNVIFGSTANFDMDTEINTGELYISWWHLWDSGELANLSDDTHKILYLYTDYPDDYIILRIDDAGNLRLFVNADGSAGWPYTAGDDPTNNYQYGYNLPTTASIDDGRWHHFAIWIAYGTGGGSDSAIKVWLDNTLLLDVDDAVAINQTGDEGEFFCLPSNISAAGTTVTTVGWQVDDIEVHDVLPSAGSSATGIDGASVGCFMGTLSNL